MRERRQDSGATAVEYALMTGLIAAVIAGVVTLFGQAVLNLFTPITSMLPLRRAISPMMVRINTVLPPPEAPTRPSISPRRTSRFR